MAKPRSRLKKPNPDRGRLTVAAYKRSEGTPEQREVFAQEITRAIRDVMVNFDLEGARKIADWLAGTGLAARVDLSDLPELKARYEAAMREGAQSSELREPQRRGGKTRLAAVVAAYVRSLFRQRPELHDLYADQAAPELVKLALEFHKLEWEQRYAKARRQRKPEPKPALTGEDALEKVTAWLRPVCKRRDPWRPRKSGAS